MLDVETLPQPPRSGCLRGLSRGADPRERIRALRNWQWASWTRSSGAQLKDPAPDRLFALSTAHVTLEVELGLRSAGAAAVCFKPLSAGTSRARSATWSSSTWPRATRARRSSTGATSSASSGSSSATHLEDLVTTVHLVSSGSSPAGSGRSSSRPVPLPGTRRRRARLPALLQAWDVLPVHPDGQGQRDNARELGLKAKLDGELPIEEDLSRWFGIYDAPI